MLDVKVGDIATHGIKRYLAMDKFRLSLVHALEIPKTTILLDNGYHPERIRKELEKFYPEIRDKL